LFLHWNNREYRIDSELQLDPDGHVVSQTIKGTSPFGATIDESFSYMNGAASWQTTGEKGGASNADPAFYVPVEFGALGSLEALVRAGAQESSGNVALFPSGTARVEKIISTGVKTPDGQQTVSLYAVSGLDFTPIFAWFADDMTLVARDLGRMGMIPKGWDREVLKELGRMQSEQDALYIERLSSSLATRLEQPLVISHVNVVDVENGRLLEDRHVSVIDGKIAAVSGTEFLAANALVIDGSGKTLIPGLWDMHGHFSLADGVLNIAGGITSVRDLGSTHERIMELVEKYDSGQVIGPHTYRGAMIDKVGPYANRNPVESLEQALELVDRFASQGYIQIKLYSSIDPGWVPAIAERAHSHGMRLSGHVPAFMSAEQAVRAGYDEIQHINMIFLNFLVADREDTRQQLRFTTYGDEGGKLDLDSDKVNAFIDLLLDKEVVVDTTAAVFDEMMRHLPGEPSPTYAAIIEHLPPSVQRAQYTPSFEIGAEREAAWAATAKNQARMIRKLYESGIQLIAGSDGMAAFTVHRELETYAEAGIPNAAILKIATLDAARVVGVDKQTGSITIGKNADLVLLQGNPLEDISAVRRAELVITRGRLYKPAELFAAVGVKPFLE
jgi:hypothetical protein